MPTAYQDFKEISELQEKIMHFVAGWVHQKKVPVPLKEVIKHMKELEGIQGYTTQNACNQLVYKGFLRRAVQISNTTSYVQLRTIS